MMLASVVHCGFASPSADIKQRLWDGSAAFRTSTRVRLSLCGVSLATGDMKAGGSTCK